MHFHCSQIYMRHLHYNFYEENEAVMTATAAADTQRSLRHLDYLSSYAIKLF